MLHEQLTENDVKKIKEEIEYRKLTVRKNAICLLYTSDAADE